MTSFGGKVDDYVNTGSTPYVFKVEGHVYHSLGSLCSTDNEPPRFLQIYIYDTDNEIMNRLQFFDGITCSRLSVDVVSTILTALEGCNKLVRLFRNARDFTLSSNLPSFTIRLYDIVIRHKATGPQRISNLHPLYMALQYPLLFIYGESGWSRDLRLSGVSGKEDKNISMNMFYSYQLHDRLNIYTLLLRGGRLFQQYLVDAYVCIEQNKLEYYRCNQSSLRSDVLKGIHDAIRRGDTEGRDIGKRTIRPSLFTGGPRYMYKHYQDALAICRVHGNPQYFITFTCNVNWPEIRRYLTKYPVLQAQDHPDIIARVFHMKVASTVNFLRNNRPFGKVYFGKNSRSCKDPDLHRIVTDFIIHGPCGTVRPNAPCMSFGPSFGDTEGDTTFEIDKIKNYVDGRFICPHESAEEFLISTFINGILQYRENRDNEKLENIVRNPLSRRTTLTEWLYNNCNDESGRHLNYVDFLSEYRWDASSKRWIRRITNRTPAIGRLIYVHPACGETFYLRLLLSHKKGCRSFEDIRTVSGEVSNPKQLWDMHWQRMADDVVHKHHLLNDDDKMKHVLYELELLLHTGSSSSLSELGLPMPNPIVVASVTNRLLMEERNYDKQQLAIEHMSSRSDLNPQQKSIYDYVLSTLE
ncbi:uncharacterized protein LOC110906453 [Helianthus annuus]|uniref:uncharacterized protein LOC110906453 n=1 Tax=Helianthus annuus TaxID=4232 RepID=UPI000B900487|nr:uncharacterized protein LOC110906453 [Helianthus annuus]